MPMLMLKKLRLCLNFILRAQGFISDFRIDPPQVTEVNPFNENSSDVSRRIQVRKTSQRARIFHRRLCRNFENYKKD